MLDFMAEIYEMAKELEKSVQKGDAKTSFALIDDMLEVIKNVEDELKSEE